ncbi:MAG: tRNA 2-thiocytidine(32) synthetase TtcA [Spirochaetia bacterium]|nr:tRNA 2-thiocytidine(32) synthetase TtcA [Spirochaetia bacterium]
MIPSRSIKKLVKTVGKTNFEYGLIEKNDRVMVAISGGKDSLTMLSILQILRNKSPVPFDIFAYTLDQGQPDFNKSILEDHYKLMGIEYEIGSYDIFSVLKEKLDPDQTPCFLCSRIRRGILYSEAKRLKATKIALGHHADDAAETLMMNLFYNGRLAAIPPKLVSDDGQNTVIRPLIEVNEKDIIETASAMKLPIIPCTVCGTQEKLQRKRMKEFLNHETLQNPNIKASMKNALKNVQPRHLWDNKWISESFIQKEIIEEKP